MTELKIDYLAPNGKELPNQSSQKFIERLSDELSNFNKHINGDESKIKPDIEVVSEGNAGLPELIHWVFNFYHHHKDEIQMAISFISNLRLIVKTFWGDKSPKVPKQDDNRVEIAYKGKKITLPTTDEQFEKFIKSLKKSN